MAGLPAYQIAEHRRCRLGSCCTGGRQSGCSSWTVPRNRNRSPSTGWDLAAETVDVVAALDRDFAGFAAKQYNQRWDSGELSPRERALACIAADVLNQTLDESFSLHIDLALAGGAGAEQVRALLLLVAEYGIAKAWRVYRALAAR